MYQPPYCTRMHHENLTKNSGYTFVTVLPSRLTLDFFEANLSRFCAAEHSSGSSWSVIATVRSAFAGRSHFMERGAKSQPSVYSANCL